MNNNLTEFRNVLILSPHPDDEALGCSGAVMLLNAAGASSRVVFITNGEGLHGEPSAEVAEKRVKEGIQASGMIGCREPIFLGFPDGGVKNHTGEVYERLKGIIEEERPDLVISPSPIDHHADHIATARAALDLFNKYGSFRLAFYEIYSTVRFTHIVDITDVAERKRQAILNYMVSLYGSPELYVHAALGLNAQRSIFTGRQGYYEAFYVSEKCMDFIQILDFLCYRV